MTTLLLALALSQPNLIQQNSITEPRTQHEEPRHERHVHDWVVPAIPGVNTVSFDLPEGQVNVYLPETIVSGDTISGSVFPVLEKGAHGDRALNAMSVEVGQTKAQVGDSMFTLQIPDGANNIDVNLLNAEGGIIERKNIAVVSSAKTAADFASDSYFQTGLGIVVRGPFDGDRRNTEVLLNGSPAGVLTECPREAVITTTAETYGPDSLSIVEQKNLTTERHFEAKTVGLSVTVNPPTDGIRVGGRASAAVDVNGLQDVPSSDFPVRVLVTNNTPKFIRLEGKDPEHVVLEIREQDVTRGHFCAQVPFKAKGKGNYSLSGQILGKG